VSRRDILRSVPLRALLIAEIISTSGGLMTWVALPWFVLTTTGSAQKMTLVIAAELLGLGITGLPAGVLLQKIGARRSMLLADATRAPLMLLIPVLHWTVGLHLAVLIAVSAALGALGSPYNAAQRMIVPELLGEDEKVVGQANALFQGAIRTTILLGPLLGGVLIAAFNAPVVLVIDAATYIVSFLLVLVFVPHREVEAPADSSRGLLSGLRFLVHEPLLRVWMPIFTVGDMAWQAFFVTVPVLVVERFHSDPRLVGIIFAAFGLGAVVGNMVAFRWLVERVPGMRLIAFGQPFQALPLWLLVFHVPALWVAVALGLSGVANGVVNPSLHSIMTLRMPPAIRAKAMTATSTINGLAYPVGLFAVAPILAAFGAQPVLVIVAAVQSAVAIAVSLTTLRVHARTPRAEPEPTAA
jgi:MFS family permease